MSDPTRKHYVVFYSPGTMFSEIQSKPIDSWDTASAMQLAGDVVERYGAKPYGFRFETRIVAQPLSDGEGGQLRVEPKTVEESGTYHINAKLETVDEVAARNDLDERIMLSNMRCNDLAIVAITTNSYKSTQPFREEDFVVDAEGNVVERGDDAKHVEYRGMVMERTAC